MASVSCTIVRFNILKKTSAVVMGSSKKHKEKGRERDAEDRHREHKKHRHKDREREKERDGNRDREKRKRSRSRERPSRGTEKDKEKESRSKGERSGVEPRVKKERSDPGNEDSSCRLCDYNNSVAFLLPRIIIIRTWVGTAEIEVQLRESMANM